jgi:hypothetical protein
VVPAAAAAAAKATGLLTAKVRVCMDAVSTCSTALQAHQQAQAQPHINTLNNSTVQHQSQHDTLAWKLKPR